MSKEKVFHTTGVTATLADGQVRQFTLVAVVTTTPVRDKVRTEDITKVGNVTTFKNIITVNEYEEQTLAIGLAIVSPADVPVSTPEQGIAIAKGKALKLKSAIVVLSNRQGYFTNTFVKNILEIEAQKVSKNPAKYVHITARQPEYKAPSEIGFKTA